MGLTDKLGIYLITILFVGTGFASFIAYLVPKVLLMIVSTYLVTSVSSLIWVKRVSALCTHERVLS